MAFPDCQITRKDARAFGTERQYRVEPILLRRRYEIATGETVPKGMVLMHRCDEPRCDNIEHLEVGTQSQNIRDAISRGRLVPPAPGMGAANPRAKVTSSQVLAIRWLFWTGQRKSVAELAREFSLGWSQTKRIVTREHWPHLLFPAIS